MISLVKPPKLETPSLLKLRLESPTRAKPAHRFTSGRPFTIHHLPVAADMNTDGTVNEQLDAGLRAFARNDFALATKLLLPCAEDGNTRAQILLSRLYYAGNGVPADHTQYLYWLERAAAGGDKSARAKLKRMQKTPPTFNQTQDSIT